ncbi:hypothetical protein [Metapseudomonas resinovorans]|uniref:hypothetical protein n=1 Tax=Metapseudomonas resinovorans TaxID=53412 RepID=UPI0012DE8495|nr:hypothetical protein [Pseudomonas resinovorans]
MARWYEGRKNQQVHEQDDQKWRDCLNGKVLSSDVLKVVTSDFPILREELESTLWPALCRQPRPEESWGGLCLELGKELNLDLEKVKSIDQLSDCISLKYLPVLFLLVRTQSDWYAIGRSVAGNLLPKFLQVLCAVSPLSHVSAELYDLIDDLRWCRYIHSISFCGEWPLEAEGFQYGVEKYRKLIADLIDSGWFNDWGLDLSVFLAMLIKKPDDFAGLPKLLLGRKPGWIAARIYRHVEGVEAWQNEVNSARWRLKHDCKSFQP